MSGEELEAFLHEKIPLSRAMGVRVVEAGRGGRLVLEAPLAPNHNHLGTAFGGSLNAMATLAAYAMLWLELGDPGAHVVIAESAVEFLRPVSGPLRAVCAPPAPEALARFRERFTRNGRASIEARATLEQAGQSAVVFRGRFVAMHGGKKFPEN